ncbi:MAG: alpha/beta fold hydrolase [Bacteroidetes bacterium CHB5]|nr:alpha/beta fold hydrolase [Bacteroidetes bacterium CHB5]
MRRRAVRYYLLKFFLAITFVVAIFSCNDDSPSEPETPFVRLQTNHVMHSSMLNRDIRYAVLLPEGYNESEESYPVVYLLHGYGDDESAWYTSGNIQAYVDAYIAENVPMIYVMPQGFNTYYIDRYTGTYPYMEMFVEELVPEIDEKFRTKPDKSQRAVMGYSMGGYGALILPAMHPEVFTIGIPLSMSFRTDNQYIAESQTSFDNQWAPNFGPHSGASGTSRLSEYFKERSPFHFFNQPNLSEYDNLKFLIDCGDDEETLSFTNDDLHSLMREKGVYHEYRVRTGGHSFDYWRKSYREALRFISEAVQGMNYPDEPEPVDVGTLITSTDYEQASVAGTTINIMKPPGYETGSLEYPVLYMIHDATEGNYEENIKKTFSILRNSMVSNKLTKAIVVEIADAVTIENEVIEGVVEYVDLNFRTKAEVANRVIVANGSAGVKSLAAVQDLSLFSDCFLFSAQLPDEEILVSDQVFYYLDVTDFGGSYKGYNRLYAEIRSEGIDYEYRVRQGTESYQAFLNGLGESLSVLKQSLIE